MGFRKELLTQRVWKRWHGEVVDAPPSLGVPEVSLEPPGIAKVSLGGAG